MGAADVFHKDNDFAAFVSLMREAHEKVPMRLTGFCLMTNHLHLLLWPQGRGSGSLDAVADDIPCSALSSALQRQRACLAGAIQGVSRAVQ